MRKEGFLFKVVLVVVVASVFYESVWIEKLHTESTHNCLKEMLKAKVFCVGVIVISSICFVILNNLTIGSGKLKRYPIASILNSLRLFTRNEEVIKQYLRTDFINIKLEEPRKPFVFKIKPWKINSLKPRSKKITSIKSDVLWSMVTIIKSMPNDFERRKLTRETWGAYEYIDGTQFENIFIVGNSNTTEEQKKLEQENAIHGDILQMELEEKYKNIVYKTLAAMQYAGDNFPSDWMFSSADDDVLPDLYAMKERITEMLSHIKEPETNCTFTDHVPIFCGYEYVQKPIPKRNGKSKWDLTVKEYPVSSFPSCCRGAWYTMSVEKAKSFYHLSRQYPVFWIEDLYVTSFLRLKYYDNIKHNCVLSDPSVGIWTKYKREVLSVHGDAKLITKRWVEFQKKINETRNRKINT